MSRRVHGPARGQVMGDDPFGLSGPRQAGPWPGSRCARQACFARYQSTVVWMPASNPVSTR